MKFAEHLLAHITPEWRRQYIVYEDMKTMLYEAVENMPTLETSDSEEIERLTKAFDEDFLAFCEKELFKINVFYEEKLAEAKRKFDTLRKEMDALALEQHQSQSGQQPNLLKSSLGRLVGVSVLPDKKDFKSTINLRQRQSVMSSRRQSTSTVTSVKSQLLPTKKEQKLDQSLTPKQVRLDQTGLVSALNTQPVSPLQQQYLQCGYTTYGTLSTSAGIDRKKLQDLKLAFSEFYLSLVLLQNYQRLNFTGFRKIFKKHDKLIGNEEGKRWHNAHVESAFFHTNKDVDKLIEDTENIVTFHLESGDRQKAMKRLRVPPLVDAPQPWTAFRVGLYLGAFIVLVVAVTLTGTFQQTGDDWRIVFRLYRSSLFIILFIFLVGVNIYGWRAHGVNHVLIFELDPRDHLGSQDLLEIAFSFGSLWCIFVLLFLWSEPLGIPPLLNPMILNGIMLLYLFNPTKTFHYSARSWLICCIVSFYYSSSLQHGVCYSNPTSNHNQNPIFIQLFNILRFDLNENWTKFCLFVSKGKNGSFSLVQSEIL